MANTFTCLQYHVVFSTSKREPWIRADIEARLWAYPGGIARQNKLEPLLIGGFDHVHILVGIPPTLSLSEAIKRVKGGSSGWIKANLDGCRTFAWQDGYGAFTVSKSQVLDVKKYIRNQREHHRTKTFQEEYRTMLKRHEIKYDEKYLWD